MEILVEAPLFLEYKNNIIFQYHEYACEWSENWKVHQLHEWSCRLFEHAADRWSTVFRDANIVGMLIF